ncbi:unnamed protein product [Medioppia subpectinata]|uniref:Methyltransferase domain-containing protein n=1 Tax=Medioppia subpectinata TaxID=1979941 RepID=A0A7R9Q0P9_9ACAR|nr:unnamed protein product [Medioppia subpectinata]CAG2108346.1 unnamed protein product [Medioppia subpectinata]
MDIQRIDYYVDQNWEKVPKSWANCIQEFQLSDITNLLTTEPKTSFKTVLPLSLLSLRASCSALQLSRKWSPNSEIILPETRFCENNEVLDREVTDSLHPKMKYEILNRNVNQKKRHEIRRLSKLTDHLLKGIADCKTIVDCGSGQGHLSRIMSVCFGYDVISIEGNDDNVLGAQHKDTNTLKCLQRYKLADSVRMNAPKKVNCLLQENTSISEVTQNSENHLLLGLHACGNWRINTSISEVTQNSENHLLLGLHACGPLSTIILNQLKQCQSAKALLLVSCCYMKIDNKSFPLSQMVKRSPVPEMSYQAKEVACHAIEKFVHKLQTNEEGIQTALFPLFDPILSPRNNWFNSSRKVKALLAMN